MDVGKLSTEKLEPKKKPERRCPRCLGYGVITIRYYQFDISESGECLECKGVGWVV